MINHPHGPRTINPAHKFLQETYEAFHKQEFRRQIALRRNDSPVTVDLTHPFFMYLSPPQGREYEAAINQPEFQAHIYTPIAAVYESSFAALEQSFSQPYDYIDLGPGYTEYLSIVNRALFRKNRPRFYIPVDVNLHLLRKLSRYTRQLSLTTIPFNTLFELLPAQLETLQLANGVVPRIFNIGLTFNNYTPQTAIRLVRSLLDGSDVMILCAESPKGISIDDLLTPYRNQETESFNRASIMSLELPPDGYKYEVQFTRGRIEMGFRICKPTLVGGNTRLMRDDFLRTCISYRYHHESLVRELKRHFKTVSVVSTSGNTSAGPFFFTVLVSQPKTYEC
jgi:hypothetical protein